MNALRTAFIVSIIGVVAFGIAACGANQKSTSTGPGGGDITVTMTSFLDYVDPQLSNAVEGREVLWNVYPLAHLQARTSRGRHRGRARSGRGHAGDRARRQDIQAQATVEHAVLGRHTDQGLRLQLCDSAAVQ